MTTRTCEWGAGAEGPHTVQGTQTMAGVRAKTNANLAGLVQTSAHAVGLGLERVALRLPLTNLQLLRASVGHSMCLSNNSM